MVCSYFLTTLTFVSNHADHSDIEELSKNRLGLRSLHLSGSNLEWGSSSDEETVDYLRQNAARNKTVTSLASSEVPFFNRQQRYVKRKAR